ncbi:hypothetical protein FPQ18DRAFT_23725 [Pyronema domesticum]|nr:hypothetical protein FPQ18DRAFT_23725 [Pyronema domesticum]
MEGIREQIIENCKFLFGGDPIILTTGQDGGGIEAFVVDRGKCRFLSLQRSDSKDQPLVPACEMESQILVASGLHKQWYNSNNDTWSNRHITVLHTNTTKLVEEKLQANTKQAEELEDTIKTEFERLSIDIDNEELKKELWNQLFSQAIEEKLQKEEQRKADIRERARQLINKPIEESDYASSVFTDTATVFTDSTVSPDHATDTHSAPHNSGGSRNSISQQHSHSDSHGQNTTDLIHELLRKQRDDLMMKLEKEAGDVQQISQHIEAGSVNRCQKLRKRIDELEKKLSGANKHKAKAEEEAKESNFQEALRAIKNSSLFSTIATIDVGDVMSKSRLLVAKLDNISEDFAALFVLFCVIVLYESVRHHVYCFLVWFWRTEWAVQWR